MQNIHAIALSEQQRERIRTFVEALRSDRYEQGLGKLKDPGLFYESPRFCCLGVAEDLRMKDVGEEWGDRVYESKATLSSFGCAYYGFETNPMLDIRNTEFHDEATEDFLPATWVNDSIRLNFHQIADLFERTYLIDDGDRQVGDASVLPEAS